MIDRSYQILGQSDNFVFFDQISPKKVYKTYSKKKKKKKETHYSILQIPISLGTKFKLKLTIFIFLDQIFPNRVFLVENRKVNITIQFCKFELVYNQSQNI